MQKLNFLLCLLLAQFFISCGASKKLQEAQSALEQQSAMNVKLNADNAKLKSEVNRLIEGNKEANAAFSQYRAACEQTAAKLQVARAILVDEYTTLQKMEERLETAMANFKDKGVSVYEKDGLVYVSLEDALLYKTGSAALGQEGKDALGALASALNDYPKLKVIVVGNTDDMAFKKGSDNWSLSTERANTVVRLLRDSYSVDPVRLTAAGKSKYAPVADNSTADGRAKNRRTDVILNPDLEKLWQSVKREQ
jgi:chemotaxis protein MotB